ncbi:MAG TPA: putative baseplate assembly protein [Rhizomicrobium sp.]
MPLSEAVPVIDDRRFDDIVEEIKARVARYTPEWQPAWNDYNDSDPGMTLAHVFAWLSEMMLYRMQKVPDLNYLKFLEMLGIELGAALPASVDITFPVKNGTLVPFVDVPMRTQVSAPADDGGAALIFETEKALRALTAGLLSLQAYDSASYRDVTADSAAQSGFVPFGDLAPVDSALVLGFGFPAGYPKPNEFPATVFDIAIYVAPGSSTQPMVSCGLTSSPVFPPAKVQWECWNGTQWQRIDMLKDETRAFTRSGYVTLRAPAPGIMTRGYIGTYLNLSDGSNPPLFWFRAHLTQAQYENPPQLVAVRTNTVSALQAQTVKGEVLGGTNGTRNQSWTLASTPLIAGSVQIQIDEGTDIALWTIRDDLLDSGKDDLDLSIDLGGGTIAAGDGVHGAIPIANPVNPDGNVIALEYRYGGGARGNVAAGAIKSMLSGVDGIDGGNVTNMFAAVGGRDEERIDDAKDRARRTIRAQSRAVTVEDFEYLAKQAGDIARAKALPLTNPQFDGVRVPGAVTVIVVPNAKRDPALPFKPVPSEGLLKTVCAYLDARRLLTTEVFVVGPSYQQVTITAQVIAENNVDTAVVQQQIDSALTTYFDAITGGDDMNGWGFGDTIRYSKLYQRIFSVDGVDSVESLTINLEGDDYPQCKDVAIDANGLLYSGAHQIEVLQADDAP